MRDRITCPEVVFFGACPCDVFLSRAKTACCEYEGGFWSLVTHLPIGKCTKALWSPALIDGSVCEREGKTTEVCSVGHLQSIVMSVMCAMRL